MKIPTWTCTVLGCAALWLARPACAGDQLPVFDAANQAFAQGRAAEATRGYESIIAKQGYSAPVLFNLANAQSREGKVGQAILSYERARWLAPRDPDIAANHRLALQRANLPMVALGWPLRCAGWLSLDGWAGLGAGSLLLLAASLPLALLAVRARPVLRLARFAAVLVFLISVVAIGSRWGELDRAVVTAKEATARISPVTIAQTAFTLPEGSLVSVVRSHGSFTLIRNLEGHQGWVSRDAITSLMPPGRRRA